MSYKSIALVVFSLLVGLAMPASGEIKVFASFTTMMFILWMYAYIPVVLRNKASAVAPLIEKAVRFYGDDEYVIAHKSEVGQVKTVVVRKDVIKDNNSDVTLFEYMLRLYKVETRVVLAANTNGMSIVYQGKQIGAITIDPKTNKLIGIKIENNKPTPCDVAKLVAYVEFIHSTVSPFITNP